jgi:hypothetical protein
MSNQRPELFSFVSNCHQIDIRVSADSQNDVLKAMLTDGVKNKEALRASDYIGFSKAWAGRL